MIFVSLWQWWYLHGWQEAFRGLLRLLGRVAGMFSVPILLKTLFSPWKQTINVPGPNTPIQVRFQWWLGNQISRGVGFFIRLSTVLAAGIILGVITLGGTVLLVAWYFMPPMVAILFVVGLLRL